MNPFTESTVACPVSKTHPDLKWRRAEADSGSCLGLDAPSDRDSVCDKSGQQPGSAARVSHPKRPDNASRSSSCFKSILAAASLGTALTLTGLFSSASGPAVIAGTAVALGAMMPRVAMAVDLNSATVQELQTVSGIGPKTAQIIVEERTRAGNFASLSDLSDRVRGIGPKKAAALKTAGLKVNADSGSTQAVDKSGAIKSSGKSARR